jgi:hypothetical protein
VAVLAVATGRMGVDRPEFAIGDRAGVHDAVAVSHCGAEAVPGKGQRAPRGIAFGRGWLGWKGEAMRRIVSINLPDEQVSIAAQSGSAASGDNGQVQQRHRTRDRLAAAQAGFRVPGHHLAVARNGEQRLPIGVPRDHLGVEVEMDLDLARGPVPHGEPGLVQPTGDPGANWGQGQRPPVRRRRRPHPRAGAHVAQNDLVAVLRGAIPQAGEADRPVGREVDAPDRGGVAVGRRQVRRPWRRRTARPVRCAPRRRQTARRRWRPGWRNPGPDRAWPLGSGQGTTGTRRPRAGGRSGRRR